MVYGANAVAEDCAEATNDDADEREAAVSAAVRCAQESTPRSAPVNRPRVSVSTPVRARS